MARLERPAAVRRAGWLTAATIAWNAVEAVVALVAGGIAGSGALIGFGLDSIIEVSSGVTVAWRLRRERDDACTQDSDRTATRIIAVSLAALALWVAGNAVVDLVTGDRPDASVVGMVLAALSLVVMPLLARAKRRIAPVLGSRAIEADASQTDICAWLSGVLLVGLGANALLGWWWADPLAALAIAGLAGHEAVEHWQAESLEDTCCG
jgi:divalent metal cation (Fe/Co/Zn/Cd) transporter